MVGVSGYQGAATARRNHGLVRSGNRHLRRASRAAAPTPAKPPLKGKQQQFVGEDLIDLNATQAAIRAGYSEKTARSQGARLLTNVDILALVTEEMGRRAARPHVDGDRVVLELARIGFSRLRGMVSDGSLILLQEAPDELAPDIKSVKVVTRDVGEGEVEHTAEIKAWDKVGALRALMPHVGLKTESSKVGTDGHADGRGDAGRRCPGAAGAPGPAARHKSGAAPHRYPCRASRL